MIINTWVPIKNYLISHLKTIDGIRGALDRTPNTVQATVFAIVTRLINDRNLSASVLAEILTVRIRLLNLSTDESGAEKQLEDIYPLLTAHLDARRSLGGTCKAATLTQVLFDPDIRVMIAKTEYMFCDYMLTIKVDSNIPDQIKT